MCVFIRLSKVPKEIEDIQEIILFIGPCPAGYMDPGTIQIGFISV